MKCQLHSDDDLDGICWGNVDVVDSIDGSGIYRCEGHAEMFLWQPDSPDGGKYIPEPDQETLKESD